MRRLAGAAMLGRRLFLLQTLLFVSSATRPACAFQHRHSNNPQFAVVPQEQLSKGEGALKRVRGYAEQEGLLDKLFGTNCFSRAVDQLGENCDRLNHEQKYRLAISLLNCHQRISGGHQYTCSRDMQIAQCTAGMSDRDHSSMMEFLMNIDSMCLFIQNQNFQAHTEHVMRSLFSGAQAANDMIASILPAMQKQSSYLEDIDQQLAGVNEAQGQMSRELSQSAQSLHQLTGQAQQLEAGIQASLVNEAATLEKQDMFMRTLDRHGQEEVLHARQAIEQWQAAQAQAEHLIADQHQHKALQQELLQDVSKLSKESVNVRTAVDLVLDYERRSDAILIRLLGKAYSWEDVLFYGTGIIASLAVGAVPPAQQARLPLLVLLCTCLAVERTAPSLLPITWLTTDLSGQVLLNPAALWWLPLPGTLNVKLCIRGAFLLLALVIVAAMLMHSWRQPPESHRLAQHVHKVEAMLREAEARHASVLKQQQAQHIAALIETLCSQSKGPDHRSMDTGSDQGLQSARSMLTSQPWRDWDAASDEQAAPAHPGQTQQQAAAINTASVTGPVASALHIPLIPADLKGSKFRTAEQASLAPEKHQPVRRAPAAQPSTLNSPAIDTCQPQHKESQLSRLQESAALVMTPEQDTKHRQKPGPRSKRKAQPVSELAGTAKQLRRGAPGVQTSSTAKP